MRLQDSKWQSMVRKAILTSSIIGVWFAVGCSTSPAAYDDPIAVMNDPKTISRSRINAMKQAEIEETDNPERIKALKEIMTGRGGHPLKVRVEAFNELLSHDEEDAKATLYYRLPTIPSNDLVAYLCNKIADEYWTEMTPSLVRSLSTGNRDIPIMDRPDTKALLRLHPGQSLNEIILNVVKQQGTGLLASRWRMSAWELLNKLGTPENELHTWLNDDSLYKKGDSFFDALHRGFVELGVVPTTVEEVKWLIALQDDSYSQWWAKCRAAVGIIPEINRKGIALRHLAVLVIVQQYHPDWLKHNRDELYSQLASQLENRQHYLSGMVGQGVSKPLHPQLITDWQEQLTWPDLITIKLADTLVHDPAIRAPLFKLVASDHLDESTEYGGILDVNDDAATTLIPMPPHRAYNDTRYRASSKMVERGYTAPFHFHLHVQEEKNRQYAGPGSGDLNYAQLMQINGLVFTSINADTLNVDYYQPGHISVDLGVLTR